MNPTRRPIVVVPDAWRQASRALSLAAMADEMGRTAAASQSREATIRALRSASKLARQAAREYGRAAGIIDSPGHLANSKEHI